jgi:hypothetical protein
VGTHDHTVIFDPDAPVSTPWIVWPAVDDMPPAGVDEYGTPLGSRFYPTATTLADGKLLVLAGELATSGPIDIPIVFHGAAAASYQYEQLTAAQRHLPFYPFAFQISDGRVFVAGSDYQGVMVDPNDPESSLDLETLLPPASLALNRAIPSWTTEASAPIKGGSAVMYGTDRILKAGGVLGSGDNPACPGADLATDRAFRIDMGLPSPAWTEVARMNFRRIHFYLVALPDGKMLAVGGQQPCPSVLEAELFDPNNPDHLNPSLRWTVMASMAEPRTYHSSAVLLPDARVLVAGGEDIGPRRTAQIFSPPYLFTTGGAAAVRPTISSAPDTIYYGREFTVWSPEAGQVTKLSLIKLGAATHSFDHDQRFLSCNFKPPSLQFPTKIDVTAPANGNLAPPGHYMLFILVNGVPSASKIVRLTCAQAVAAATAQPETSSPPWYVKNRFLTFSPGDASLTTAVRVTFTSLPAPYDVFNGRSMYVQAPKTVCEAGAIAPPQNCPGGVPTFTAATLDCDPYHFQWGTVGELHVYHQLIVPAGGYVGGADYGGGMELKNSSTLVVRCMFTGNSANDVGAGLHISGGSPNFVNCKFDRNNGAPSCGAAFIEKGASPTFVNCLFLKNEAEEAGAIGNMGGSPTFIHCTFADNKATVGKGWAILDHNGTAVLRNCIVWSGDSSAPSNNQIWNNPTLGGTTTVTHSDVLGGWTGAGNINADPLFVNPSGDDYRLCGTGTAPSPCKDTGSNSYVPSDTGDLDWDGNTGEQIPFDLTATVARMVGSTVDMGAYERTTGPCTPGQ